MKKILLMLCLVVAATACVDDNYDLSNIEDEIAIGGEGSVFDMPLVRIEVSASKLSGDGGESLQEIYDEADIWLPDQSPESTDYFDVPKLVDNTNSYRDRTVELLCDQMVDDKAKRNEVAALIGRKYAQEFTGDLPEGVRVEEFIREYYDDSIFRPQITKQISVLASNYLIDIQIDPVIYEIPVIDLSSDVIDMLCKDLDTPQTTNPKNALFIYGQATSTFSLSFRATPEIRNTRIAFDTLDIDPERTTELNYVRIFEDDVMRLTSVENTLYLPITVERYYPERGIGHEQTVNLNLSLRKTGAIRF